MHNAAPSPFQLRAQEELRRRYDARHAMLPFGQFIKRDFVGAAHVRRICAELDDLIAGKIRRLMVFLPPRHGKSEIISRLFPAYYLGRNPRHQVIAASYGQDLADQMGMDVRGIMSSLEYAHLFPKTALSQESHAKSDFRTTEGGQYFGTGVGGPAVGRGAHLLVIDDPHKNAADTDSDTKRKGVHDWWSSVIYPRLMPNARVVILMHRWHELDLAGYILNRAKDTGQEWRVLRMPALRTDADGREYALWPGWYGVEALRDIRATMQVRHWNALYQGSPSTEEGNYFERAWFKRTGYTVPPLEHLNVYITADFALSEDEKADFTEIGIWGVDHQQNCYLLHGWRDQAANVLWIEVLLTFINTYKPVKFIGEVGPTGKAGVEPILRQQFRERKGQESCPLEWLPHGGRTTSQKQVKATSFATLAFLGYIHIPETEYGEHVVNQLLKFPGGSNDDAVDMCANFGRFINRVWGADKPAPPPQDALKAAWYKRPTMAQMLAPATKTADGWDS